MVVLAEPSTWAMDALMEPSVRRKWIVNITTLVSEWSTRVCIHLPMALPLVSTTLKGTPVSCVMVIPLRGIATRTPGVFGKVGTGSGAEAVLVGA